MTHKPILGLFIVVALISCNRGKEQLLSKVDSLTNEVHTYQEVAKDMQEVGVLLDSIDASRDILRTNMVEGTTYPEYTTRLKDINRHVRETKARLNELEESLKKAKGVSATYAAALKKLKANLELQSQQVAGLQAEVDKMHSENKQLASNVVQKDSVITLNTETIKMREQDIASLEDRIKAINLAATTKEADLYFQQAQALELAAQRTKFAPRKRKETQLQALELYRIALSLGKSEAQERVTALEKLVG